MSLAVMKKRTILFIAEVYEFHLWQNASQMMSKKLIETGGRGFGILWTKNIRSWFNDPEK